jgi:hypothetical protein
MITKIFTYEEVMNLTGICAEHLQNLAKRHHLGFFVRGAETTGTPMVLRPLGLDGSSKGIPRLFALGWRSN